MWGSADLGFISDEGLGRSWIMRKHVLVHDKKVKDRALTLIMVTRGRGTTNEADEDQTNGWRVGEQSGSWKPEEGRLSAGTWSWVSPAAESQGHWCGWTLGKSPMSLSKGVRHSWALRNDWGCRWQVWNVLGRTLATGKRGAQRNCVVVGLVCFWFIVERWNSQALGAVKKSWWRRSGKARK